MRGWAAAINAAMAVHVDRFTWVGKHGDRCAGGVPAKLGEIRAKQIYCKEINDGITCITCMPGLGDGSSDCHVATPAHGPGQADPGHACQQPAHP